MLSLVPCIGETSPIETAHILVVDDEPGIVDVLTFALGEAGFQTSVAMDGPSALRLALTLPIDLILLDIMLPGIDGLEVCRQVRAVSEVPIIIVSAKGSDADRVAGLELYADDYVVKPFSLNELVARIRTILRRTTVRPSDGRSEIDSRQHDVNDSPDQAVLSVGQLRLELQTFHATWNGTQVELTRIQFDLLALFLRRPGIVFPRTQLLNEVWGHAYNEDVRTVDSMVKRLRAKLRDAGAPPDLIESKRDRGYLLQPSLLTAP